MKHIPKKIANEPESLREYRETEGAKYIGGGFNAKELKQSLLEEQGYICAYCMGRISLNLNEHYKPSVEVEHLNPRQTHPDSQLDYMNMLAVCNGLHENFPDRTNVHHCDKTQGTEGKMDGSVTLKKLNPLSKSTCEDLITYTADGKIQSKTGNEDVEHDINVVLNLNNSFLVKNRKAIIDRAQEELEKDKPRQTWNKQFFDKHLEIWQAKYDGKYRMYHMIAVWFLNRLKSSQRYK